MGFNHLFNQVATAGAEGITAKAQLKAHVVPRGTTKQSSQVKIGSFPPGSMTGPANLTPRRTVPNVHRTPKKRSRPAPMALGSCIPRKGNQPVICKPSISRAALLLVWTTMSVYEHRAKHRMSLDQSSTDVSCIRTTARHTSSWSGLPCSRRSCRSDFASA